MTGAGRWWWRLLAVAVGVAFVEGFAVLGHATVDHLRLVLVAAIVVAAAGLVIDATQTDPTSWHVPRDRTDEQGTADPRTAAYLRVLESHVTAREPDSAVRDRLRDLADQVLSLRHDLSVDDPRASELFGPELEQVLADPPRRLSVDELDRAVRRIEEL